MHQDGVSLSSEQATLLKSKESVLTRTVIKIEPTTTSIRRSPSDEVGPLQDNERRQTRGEICENVTDQFGAFEPSRRYRLQAHEDETADSPIRRPRATTAEDEEQLLDLARVNSIRMEQMTNQEQAIESKQQPRQDSLLGMLDATQPSGGSNANGEMLQNGAPGVEQQKPSAFCAGCQSQIRDKFIFSVIDLFWHQDCVQCADCSLKLIDRCYTLDGKLYCKHDYWHRFGPKCFACQQSIEQSELVQRIKGNRVYHLKCFACHECRRPLEQGEQLHLVGDKRLLCRQDFQRLSGCHRLAPGAAGGGSGEGGGHDASGQPKQNSTGNNNGSSGYLTLLGGANSAKHSANSAGSNQQKRSSLTSLDNMTLGDAIEAELQSSEQSGLLPVAGPEVEDDEADEDDEETLEAGSLVEQGALRRQRRREPLDGEMLNDEQGQFNEDENEENQLGHQTILGDDQLLEDGLQTNNAKLSKQPQTKHLLGSLANGARKKRRRKQRLAMASDKPQTKQQAGGAKAGKLVAGRNGESILNGSATSSAQQPASILAGMAALDGQSAGKLKSSCSSSSSTSSSSNHSSSNSSHQDHYQQQQQQASGEGHRLATSGANMHHHHSGAIGSQHQSTGGGGGAHKPTRVRTVLNEKQLQTLRDCYAQNPRPDALMKEQLVDMTGLSPRVIRVWFQNKRCKDKKKSILYKQMQQHEKDGRHLTGLTHIRGVPMVAASPVHYQDDHSSGATNTPMGNAVGGGGGGGGGGAGSGSGSADPGSPQQQQQQHQQRPTPTVQSPPQSNQPIDIHAYQPPWKGLVEYAQQTPDPAQQPDRLNAASPRYQQLIGQIHGYGGACGNLQVGGDLHPAQQQAQQYAGNGQAPPGAYLQSAPGPPQPPQPPQPPPPQQQQQQSQLIQMHHHQNANHLHHNHNHHHNHHHHHHHQPQQQHLAQVAGSLAGHHAGQFQH